MKIKLKDILYFPLDLLLHATALLPLRALYLLSDIIYFLTYYVVRYRVRVAENGIRESFPELSGNESKTIVKRFFRHFADYIVETVKLLHISDDEMRRRMTFSGTELIDESVNNGRSVILYLGHYANWEWIPSVTLWTKCGNDKMAFGQIYRTLRNEWFDKLFLRLRSRFNSDCIEKRETLRSLLRYRRDGKSFVVGFMSDQHPSGNDEEHVVRFLNHDTAMITGTELIARRLDVDVLYFDINKIKRGYYHCKIRKITTDIKNEMPMAVTDAYTRLLENTIRRQPELWLWTHKRWKRPARFAPVEFAPTIAPITINKENI